MKITLGRWIPALVEGIRAEEELKDEKPQVGVLEPGKHVRPVAVRACGWTCSHNFGGRTGEVNGTPETWAPSYSLQGHHFLLVGPWASHCTLSLSFPICKMEIITPLCQLRIIALRIW